MQAITVFVIIILGAYSSHMITRTATKGEVTPKDLAVPTIQPLTSAPLSLPGNNNTLLSSGLKKPEEFSSTSMLNPLHLQRLPNRLIYPKGITEINIKKQGTYTNTLKTCSIDRF